MGGYAMESLGFAFTGVENTVLIVDDNQQVRRMIRALVEDMVDEFIECEDGSLALAAYSEHRPDWVLMDVEMKEMDGLTATSRIIEAFPQAKIVVVTRYRDPKIREMALRNGARAFVLKDNLLELREIISSSERSY
jgi:two-component system, NarL family, response regulator LiaR